MLCSHQLDIQNWEHWQKMREIIILVAVYTEEEGSLCLCNRTNSGKFLKRWEYKTTLPAS